MQRLFQFAKHFLRKAKPYPDPYLSLTDPDADPGGPKHPDPEHWLAQTMH